MQQHQHKRFFALAAMLAMILSVTWAGNPDRQGEAGAYELLMLPWARTAGLNALNVANVSGVEAMRINVAGISRINKAEFAGGFTDYLSGTDTELNSFGLAIKLGKEKRGALGVSVMAVNFGDIRETTEDQPDGTGAFINPSFFNIGIGYSYIFENKISVGFGVRVVSESISNVSGIGVGFDAGVQYVTGEHDNFKFGIALRNIGTRMQFDGQGLDLRVDIDGDEPGQQFILKRDAADFELPSLLHIGISNDFYVGGSMIHRLTALGGFTANSFSRDQLGAGLEYGYKERFMLRASYKREIGEENENVETNYVYDGLGVGASVALPLSRRNTDTRLNVHYAYRTTEVFDGSHSIGVTIEL